MNIGARKISRSCFSLGVACILVAVLTACTGRGGGYLAPDGAFNGRAALGFTFSCEDSGGLNPRPGKLRIQLAYSEQGSGPSVKGPFSIHGTPDVIDPVLESMVCAGKNPPPGGNELIFLGRFRPTSTSLPAGFPKTCPTRETVTASMCRFEVIVQDNDHSLTPSKGDFFSIKLTAATAFVTDFETVPVFYVRAGYLAGGNLTVT
jgi:hypothetical protein